VVVPLTFLHLAPHPDDESIGAPMTQLALRDAGHAVINVAVSLGRPADHARRLAEVREACRRAGFALVDTPRLAIGGGDDRDAAQAELTGLVAGLIAERGVDVVVAPSPQDGHHGHEVVGRAARDAVAATRAPRLWFWGLWADLPWPTLYAGFADEALARAEHVLAAHAGELARNDYAALLRARAVASRTLGAERVFGFGSPVRPQPYAELLTEVVHDGEWRTGAARELDPADPLAAAPAGGAWRSIPIAWWLYGASFFERAGRPRPS
jgi:LmbE family N-acetylglucosaminyl deacetylase